MSNSVLVIDDEKVVSDVLERALKKSGYRVETAFSGKEGLKKFDAELHDFVITDIIMSEVDGMAVLKHIRQSKKPSTPVIGMSGTPWYLRENCFDAAVAKPFSLSKMLNTIEDIKCQFQKEKTN